MTSNLPRHRERTEGEYIDEPRSLGPLRVIAAVLCAAGGLLFLVGVIQFLPAKLSGDESASARATVCTGAGMGCTILGGGAAIAAATHGARNRRR